MKAGEIEEMKYFLSNRTTADNLWASYLIAKRHHYQINNIGMWCDYLMMLKNLDKDIRNPKNICPQDFIEAHDRVNRLIDAKREKARAERERQYEIERREAMLTQVGLNIQAVILLRISLALLLTRLMMRLWYLVSLLYLPWHCTTLRVFKSTSTVSIISSPILAERIRVCLTS